MNSRTEDQIYMIYRSLVIKTSGRDADRMSSPLIWYIGTGRCSGAFIRIFNHLGKRQLTTIANRLIKANGDYAVIDGIAKYVLSKEVIS